MILLATLRWVLFFAAAFLGATFVVANWSLLLAWLLHRKRGSAVPLVGGALLAFAIVVVPGPSLRWLWWLPLVLDPGCLLSLVAATVFWLRGGFGASSGAR